MSILLETLLGPFRSFGRGRVWGCRCWSRCRWMTVVGVGSRGISVLVCSRRGIQVRVRAPRRRRWLRRPFRSVPYLFVGGRSLVQIQSRGGVGRVYDYLCGGVPVEASVHLLPVLRFGGNPEDESSVWLYLYEGELGGFGCGFGEDYGTREFVVGVYSGVFHGIYGCVCVYGWYRG